MNQRHKHPWQQPFGWKVMVQMMYLCCAHIYAAKVILVDVMSPGDTSVNCTESPCKYAAFRIPGLLVAPTKDGGEVMIAVAEGRKTGCGDFSGVHDLVVRRSLDHGRTWGELVTVIDSISFWPNITAKTPPEKGNAIWDPTPVADRTTGRIFVFFNGPGRLAHDGLSSTWMMWSDDAGITWDTRNVTSECQRSGTLNAPYAGSTPGNGHGVQLSTGRLVIPMYSGEPAGASMCYSDDHGETWHASQMTVGGVAACEIEIAELNSENSTHDLYMTIRNDGAKPPNGGRQFSISHDQGMTWSTPENVQVPDPACKGSVVQWESGPGMVLSTAASCTGRVNQTVFVSMDNGSPGSWIYHQFIHPESGYSTLQMANNDSTIALFFEKGGCTLTVALVDPREMLKDNDTGYLSCAATHCGGANPTNPSVPPDPKIGFCQAKPSPPPPPSPPPNITAQCQKKLDAFCSSNVENGDCVDATVHAYPDAQPFVARYDTGCSIEPKKPWPHGFPVGPCQAGGAPKAWRCYSHLALGTDGGWSNDAQHPNVYCTESSQIEKQIQQLCT